jgi:hypothetical protein
VEKKQGDVVALKKLPSSGGNTLVFREPMLHHNLSHPNILELKGSNNHLPVVIRGRVMWFADRVVCVRRASCVVSLARHNAG